MRHGDPGRSIHTASFAALALVLLGMLAGVSSCTIRVGTGSIDVVNGLGAGGAALDIVELWVGPAGTEVFTTEVPLYGAVGPGATASIVALQPGSWSVLAVDELGNHYVVDGVVVSAGHATSVTILDGDLAVATGQSTGGIEVVNGIAWADGDSQLTSLYVDPSDSVAWGTELLAGGSVWPGASVTVDGLAPGDYDILGEDQDGLFFALYGIPVGSGATTQVTLTAGDLISDLTLDRGTPAVAGTGLIRVVNGVDWADGASYALTEVYLAIAPVTSPADWGTSLLPAALMLGASQAFDEVVEGTWEVYAVDDAGNGYRREDVPVWAGAETIVTITVDDLDP